MNLRRLDGGICDMFIWGIVEDFYTPTNTLTFSGFIYPHPNPCKTMAVKSHIRNARPVVLCIATNDALAGSAKNIGALLNNRNYYFVPFRQDDYKEKPTSLVADFELIPKSIENALNGKQVEPLFV